MVENPQGSEITPKIPEGQPHICPTCEREFKGIIDYPRVFVTSVSVITPDDVPAEIPGGWSDDLFKVSKKGHVRELVPDKVLEYFRAHPDKDKLAHTDSYIYSRRNAQKDFRELREKDPEMADRFGGVNIKRGYSYSRRFNYAPTMRALLERNTPLREYLESLQQLVGQEVPTREVFPNWQQLFSSSIFQVPSGFGVPNVGEFFLSLSEDEQNTTKNRIAEIDIGENHGRSIERRVSVGALNYEGRVNRT